MKKYVLFRKATKSLLTLIFPLPFYASKIRVLSESSENVLGTFEGKLLVIYKALNEGGV